MSCRRSGFGALPVRRRKRLPPHIRFLRHFWVYRWWDCSRHMRAKGRSCYGWRDHRDGMDGYES